MFKNLGNIASMMKQAQEMQGKMKEMQETLTHIRVEGTAGGGMVKVEANGQQQFLSFKIEQSLLEDGDAELLEDLLLAASNQALEKVKEAAAAEMSKVTGGMDIPGLGDALADLGLGGEDG